MKSILHAFCMRGKQLVSGKRGENCNNMIANVLLVFVGIFLSFEEGKPSLKYLKWDNTEDVCWR